MNVEQILYAMGSPKIAAQETGVAYGSMPRWKRTGIPDYYWERVIEVTAANGITVTPAIIHRANKAARAAAGFGPERAAVEKRAVSGS